MAIFSPSLSPRLKNHLNPSSPSQTSRDSEKNHTKVLVANSVFLIKSEAHPNLPPWLFTGEELFPGSLSVRRPLSRDIVESYELPDDFPYELDLSKFRVLELGMFYNYNYLDDNTVVSDFDVDDVPVLVPYTKMPKKPSFSDENKVVLFVNPNCETGCRSIDDCMVVELSKEVGLTVKSLRNGAKRKVYFMGKRKFDDIVSFKGKIYAVDRKGRVCSMDYNSLKMSSVVEDPPSGGSSNEKKKRLVVSSDDELYLVYRWSKKGKAAFNVFKLNEEEEKWDMVDGIGSDRMFFPQYSGKMTLDSKILKSPYLDEIFIAVYHFEGGDCKPVYDYPGYADIFWPPPSLVWNDVCLNTRNSLDLIPEFKDQKSGDSVPAANSPPPKIAEKDGSGAKFFGVDVSSHLIPILQKIWDKCGNIIEGHVVNSGSLLTWALESLAKMIIFLENNEGRSLDDSQADYLNSVLLDLRLMHFKLDWLMPSVEKVLAPHKNKVCMDFEKTNLEFQTEFHWVEEMLAEPTKLVSESQVVSAEGPCPVLDLLSFIV
uniref:KIB1-4 beta-propeller domain-containing protein n=1 Tax=Chenopodium quinoa TaxID=63459 RepID=A0A803MFT6_CHEQI